jgi:3-hydroxy-9,10-secoandrosta-1,3,5(10)-triene-9,17-dione monooxygenase
MVALAVDLAGPPVGPAAQEGAVFTWPYFAIAPFAIVGAPLGVARGAMAASLEGVKRRLKGLDDEIVASQAALFSRLSHCEQDIECAHDIILKDLEVVDTQSFEHVSPVVLARFRRSLAAAPQRARHAANRLFEGAGGSAIYVSNPLERMLRDVNAGAAHYAFTDDLAAPNYGRALLGLPPAKSNNFV